LRVRRVDGRRQRIEQAAIPRLARLEALLRGLALADVLKAVHAADEASIVIE
jgi:hypothetical protein